MTDDDRRILMVLIHDMTEASVSAVTHGNTLFQNPSMLEATREAFDAKLETAVAMTMRLRRWLAVEHEP